MNGTPVLPRLFQPSLANERPISDLTVTTLARWQAIAPAKRAPCVDKLVHMLQHSNPELVATWQRQRRDGLEIGSDDLHFHFGTGMQIRNALRDVLPDKWLPPASSDQEGMGHPGQWDDYYMGALHEALAQLDDTAPPHPHPPPELELDVPPVPQALDIPVFYIPYARCGYAVQATHLLRYVRRGWLRRRSLQQCYVILEGDGYTEQRREWRDVEVVHE